MIQCVIFDPQSFLEGRERSILSPCEPIRAIVDLKSPKNMTEATITAIALDPREIIKDMVASFVGSAACVYTGQPFDTVKVRLQCATPGQYRGTIDCSRYIIANEGVLKLFSGSLPALTGALLENATAFAVNGTLKRFLGDRDKVKFEDKPFYEPFLTGGITGFTVAFVLCPCDMLKCRAQVSKSKGA